MLLFMLRACLIYCCIGGFVGAGSYIGSIELAPSMFWKDRTILGMFAGLIWPALILRLFVDAWEEFRIKRRRA